MSKIIGRPLYAPAPAGGGKPSAPKFTYDGDYVIRDDGVVELLTSGTITFLSPAVIDIFCVGGGGGGGRAASGSGSSGRSGGGGGGYTTTVKSLRVLAQQAIPITIGDGGNTESDGGASSWGDYSANGGLKGRFGESGGSAGAGGNGGSGGGTGNNGKGGSDGSNGGGGLSHIPAGIGQGSTTREFGELTGKLYAGGGSGAGGGTGGEGGGGNAGYNSAGGDGVANSGGGGGGTKSYNASTMYYGGKGGSGIVCFRAAK